MTGSAETVLIISDDHEMAGRFADWLGERWAVQRVCGGSQALAALEDEPPVVLLDRQLTGIHGDRLLGMVREDELDCRVAMLTAVQPGIDAMRLGFDDFLVKPVDREHLLQTVSQLFSRADYDRGIREFYALAAEKARIESSLPPEERDADEEYREVSNRLPRVRDELDDVLEEFRDHESYIRLCKELSRPAADDELDDAVPEQ